MSSRPWIDAGYHLVLPIALLFMLWFRRGWTVQWTVLVAILATAPQPAQAEWRMLDLWLSEDQQGRYYFEKEDYHTAALRFRDPLWKGTSYYLNEDFDLAAEIFSGLDTEAGLFALANAWAHGRHYLRAITVYDRLIERNPRHDAAITNRDFLIALVEEINRMSESQQSEPGESSDDLGDAPRTAEGAERESFDRPDFQQYGAEEILADPALNEMWMRQIQSDPSRFLRVKFQMQLHRDSSRQEVEQ